MPPVTHRTPRRDRGVRALRAGALGLAVAFAAAACGFSPATDSIYYSAPGTDHRKDADDVTVLSAVVVSAQEGSGTFIATFSNSSISEADTVTAIDPSAEESQSITVSGFSPIEIAPTAFVNLADEPPGINVSGDFMAGDYVTLQFTLERSEQFEMAVPVVEARDFYEGLDTSAPDTPAGGPSSSPTPEGGDQ